MIRKARRHLSLEPLEQRQLLAVDLHNFLLPNDVNDDGQINSLDALHLINRLNARASSNPDVSASAGYFDVNDDSRINSLDALKVINLLNRRITGDNTAADPWVRISSDDATRAAIRLSQSDQGIELEIRLRGATSHQNHAVFLDDSWLGTIEVDHRGRGRIEFRPDVDLSGLLPSLLVAGRSMVNLKIEGIGEVELRNNANSSNGAAQAGESDQSNRSKVFIARLRADGQIRGEALFVQHGQRKFLGVYARGLTADESYPVRVGEVLVATLRANRAGVVIGHIDPSRVENFPTIERGTLIRVGSYTGEFIPLADRPRPDPPRDFYVANFRQERLFGNAQLMISEERTKLRLELARVTPGSVHDIFIDDVKIAQVRAGRGGILEFRYDSNRGDSLLAPIPTITDQSVIRVGSLVRARLVRVGPGR